jgi:hypothetical protein
MSSSPRCGSNPFGQTRRPHRLAILFLRDIHDHAREQIQARLDGIEQDVFRISGMGAETLEPEPLDHRRLGVERGESRVCAAAFRHLVNDQLLTELAVNLLCVLRKPRDAVVASNGGRRRSKFISIFASGNSWVFIRSRTVFSIAS